MTAAIRGVKPVLGSLCASRSVIVAGGRPPVLPFAGCKCAGV